MLQKDTEQRGRAEGQSAPSGERSVPTGERSAPAYLRIGRVLKPQGLRGEIKVEVTSEDPSRFLQLKQVYVERRGKVNPASVFSSVLREGHAYIVLEGYEDRDAAELLRGAYLCVKREDAIPLPEGRWFIVDLLGCQVAGEDGHSYGILVGIHQYGAADIYVLRPPEGVEDIWIPLTDELLVSVDLEAKRIVMSDAAIAQRGVWNPR